MAHAIEPNNGALFEAAPDLLVALEDVQVWMEDHEEILQDSGEWGDREQDLCELIAAAIAKAKGAL